MVGSGVAVELPSPKRRKRGAAKLTGTYRNEVIDESAGRAAVAENVAGSKAADIEITIRTKDQVARKVEAAFAGLTNVPKKAQIDYFGRKCSALLRHTFLGRGLLAEFGG
jgi:hypothetical protein